MNDLIKNLQQSDPQNLNPNIGISVAFDITGTLLHSVGEWDEVPRYEILALVSQFKALGCRIILWSSSGTKYASLWAKKLGIRHVEILEKGSMVPDICFDDINGRLGKINIKV